MFIESQGKLEKSQGKVREFCVRNLADTLKQWNRLTDKCSVVQNRYSKDSSERLTQLDVNSRIRYFSRDWMTDKYVTPFVASPL